MKHKISITLIILAMFIVTQVIGLFVINAYTTTNQKIVDPATGLERNITVGNDLPYGLKSEEKPTFLSLVFSFVLAIALILILMRYRWKSVIRIWFLFVVTLALGITLTALFSYTQIRNASIVAIIVAIPLAALKIFRPTAVIHNSTELLIYPGIAAVFVQLMTPRIIIGVLIAISIYDMWAVWRSEVMQKMAKFQMEELKIFGGFLIPTVSKSTKDKIKLIRQKYKGKKVPKKIQSKKFKINLAILGGGDVVFPLIAAGVFMKYIGLTSALFVVGGALVALMYLLFITKKGKAYPAMPYISTGIFLSLIIYKILTTYNILIP